MDRRTMGDAVTWNAYLAESVNSSVSFIPLFDFSQEGIRVVQRVWHPTSSPTSDGGCASNPSQSSTTGYAISTS